MLSYHLWLTQKYVPKKALTELIPLVSNGEFMALSFRIQTRLPLLLITNNLIHMLLNIQGMLVLVPLL